MASANNWEKWIPFLIRWEGGKADDPLDRGGLTFSGVTIGTFNQLYTKLTGKPATLENFQNLKKTGEWRLFIKYFYNLATFNNSIKDDSIALLMADIFWGSGYWGIGNVQRRLNEKYGFKLATDGAVGPMTVAAINKLGPSFLPVLVQWRRDQFNAIVNADPSQKRFIRGWMNRINDFARRYKVVAAVGGGLFFFVLGSIIYFKFINKNAKKV